MLSVDRIFIGIMLMALITSSCQPINAPSLTNTMPESNRLRPDTPPYAVNGTFWVGYRPPVSDEGKTRPIEISIWYPALNPRGIKEEVRYEVKWKDTTWSPKTIPTIYGQAFINAGIDGSKGPYPLIIFSHGFSGSAAGYSIFAEHYASYGFIVLAPEHTEKIRSLLGGSVEVVH